jgi:hypothetical protein
MPLSDQRLLQKIFKNFLSQYRIALRAQVASGNSSQYYTTAHVLNGMLSAIEATKDMALLKETVGYLDTMVRCAADHNGDGHLEWLPLDSTNMPFQLYSFQGAVPIARAAAIIMRTPAFSAYRAAARRYVAFLDNSIVSYWFDKINGVYKVVNPATWPWLAGQIPLLRQDLGGTVSPTDQAIWNDKAALLGQIAACLYAATGNLLYLDIAGRVATHFMSLLKPNGSGWIWDNKYDMSVWAASYGENRVPQHDTDHANRDPMMMVLMYEAAVSYKGSPVFGVSDLRRMANTLTDIIWTRSLQTPKFANYINGAMAGYGTFDDPTAIGTIYFGWALLGKYSPKAQAVMAATLQYVMNGGHSGQNDSIYAKIAFPGHLLRNCAT